MSGFISGGGGSVMGRSALAYPSADIPLTNDGNRYKVNLDTTVNDDSGMISRPGSITRWTAPVKGNYLVTWNPTLLAAGLSSGIFSMALWKNGSLYPSGDVFDIPFVANVTGTTAAIFPMSFVVPLDAGDYLEIGYWTTMNNTPRIVGTFNLSQACVSLLRQVL